MVEVAIHFDNEDCQYLAGGKLAGQIQIKVRQQTVIRQLFIELNGEGQNSWVNKRSEKIYESTEPYLKHTEQLVNGAESLTPGLHAFGFAAQLPDDMPASYEGLYGRIRYGARATAALSSVEDAAVAERAFVVVGCVSLRAQPASARRPVEAIDSTAYTCCCVPVGVVRICVTLARNGYVVGETVAVSAQVQNGSQQAVDELQLQLIQQARFVSRSRYEDAEDTKRMEYVVASAGVGRVGARKLQRFAEELRVPTGVVPTFDTRLLSVAYVLRVTARPGVEFEVPLTIGTLP